MKTIQSVLQTHVVRNLRVIPEKAFGVILVVYSSTA